MSRNHKIYIATISENCVETARNYNLGLECDTFCTAVNLENPEMIRQTEQQLEGFSRKVLHAPFNELCPAAIEPEVVRITRMRYEQAWEKGFEHGKLTVTGGEININAVSGGFSGRSTPQEAISMPVTTIS